jgi:MFS family permease
MTNPSPNPPSTGAPTPISTAQDVNRVLGAQGSHGHKSKAIVLLALGGIFMDAYDMSSLAFGITAIRTEFGLDGFMTGLTNAAIMIGAVIGAVFGGYLTDRFGRYKLFMADMVFFVVAAVGCALSPNEWVLIFFRIIMGIGVGLDMPVAMAFLAEFSKLRGKQGRSQRVSTWSPIWYVATGIGYFIVLICFLSLPYEAQPLLWRIVVGFGAIPALIVLLVRRRYMAESPQWLANQGDVAGAVDVLRTHYELEVEYVPAGASGAEAAVGAAGASGAAASAAGTAIAGTRPRAYKTQWSGFAELFSKRYRLRTIVAMCVCVFSTFGYNAVGYGLPLIITTLFQQGPLVTIISSLVINLCFGAVGGFVCAGIVDRLGSRRVTLIGFVVQAVALAILAAVGVPAGGLVIVSIAMLAVFIFMQAAGPGTNLMNYATLSYPARLRGIGIGFNQAVLRTFSVVSLIFFPVVSAALSMGVFWIIACAPLLGAIVVGIVKWDPTGQDVDAESYADAESHAGAGVER